MKTLSHPPKTPHSNTPPHVYVTVWEYLHNTAQCIRNERRRNFYSRCSIVVATAMLWRRSVFRCESESTLFGLPNEYTTRNQWLSYIYNTVPEQYNANIRVCAAHFTEDCFLMLGERILQCEYYECCELGLHDILHAIVMRISSVKTVLWLAIHLLQLFSNGAAFNTQSRSSNQIKSNQITFIVTSPQHKCLGEWNSYERAPDSAEKQQTINLWTDSAKNNNRQFTYGQTVQKTTTDNLPMDRQCKKQQQTIYLWTDSAKKQQQTIYIWTDSAKNCTEAFTVLQTVQKSNSNLHMDSTYLQTVQKTMCKIHIHILSTHSVL